MSNKQIAQSFKIGAQSNDVTKVGRLRVLQQAEPRVELARHGALHMKSITTNPMNKRNVKWKYDQQGERVQKGSGSPMMRRLRFDAYLDPSRDCNSFNKK